MAGDVDQNCGTKGTSVTYSVYYYDIHQLPPQRMEVVINGKAYKMTPVGNQDYKLPVKYIYSAIMDQPVNNYYFRAGNGKKERRMPEENYELPGPFIMEK
jgi:hypothetical protein